MKIPEELISEVQDLILDFEAKTKKRSLDKISLKRYQNKLDEIDNQLSSSYTELGRNHELYELQALIHIQNGQIKIAESYLKEALKGAKSTEILYSNYLREYAEKNSLTPFVSQSLTKVLLLEFFTLGLFGIYWSIINWKAVKYKEKSQIMPFWRGVFTYVWIYPLFKRITNQSNKYSKLRWYLSPGLVGATYILAGFGSFGITRVSEADFTINLWLSFLALGVVSGISLCAMQNEINKTNLAQSLLIPHRGWSEISILVLIFGILITGVGTYNLATSLNENNSRVVKAKETVESLRKSYEKCKSSLEASSKALNLSDDSAVNTYNTNLERCNIINSQLNISIEYYNDLIGANNLWSRINQ